jgi:DNA polymerase III epsilon subunit-like protein
MLLREDLKYVVLDFETTWTDKKYDEIIQVWIVEYDYTGAIIREFSSYCKPQNTEKLHDIIDMITGISMESLQSAPDRSEIFEIVAGYFDEKTVIIWHSVWFDLAFLTRYWVKTSYTSIDTLHLAQSIKPYLPSYALEIVASHVLKSEKKNAVSYHDALVDCHATGKIFFSLLQSLESIFYSFPYLREISKRTYEWLGKCISYHEERHLLKDIPSLEEYSPSIPKPNNSQPIPTWTYYWWDLLFEDILNQSVRWNYISCFAQHQKVQLAQKTLASTWLMLPLHEPQIFDKQLLHALFTKKEIEVRERYVIVKYLTHCVNWHKSYHAVNRYDYMILQAFLSSPQHQSERKLYSHWDIFNKLETLSLPADSHIVIYDKEWLIDSRKKRRYNSVDLYRLADSIEAILYKYTLLWEKIDQINTLLSSLYIFIWIFSSEITKHLKDFTAEKILIDNYGQSLHFQRSKKIWDNFCYQISSLSNSLQLSDYTLIEKRFLRINTILSAPFSATTKRSDYAQRVILQENDTFVSRSDITDLLQWYSYTIISVLDKKAPPLPIPGNPITPRPIVKWKDIKVGDTPRICIISPSKPAAQQLITSLHKAKVYGDCFLAAEHVTWWAGKIIQQALIKKSYILVWGYGFCLQAIANGVEFDTICALDIIQYGEINPFTDISYYTAQKA